MDRFIYTQQLIQLYNEKKLHFSSNDQYVDFALTGLGQAKFARLFVTSTINVKEQASAENLRKEGNTQFEKKNFLSAHRFYTTAISIAKSNSLELAFSYSNRSAVLLNKGYYKECLEDIQRAIDNGYPKNKLKKLKLRQKKAEELLPAQRKLNYHGEIPVIDERNKNIPSASNSIEIRENAEYGRFIVAKKNISASEVILIEKPYCLDADEYSLVHCSYCTELCYNMIPCTRCIDLYCSTECRLKDYNDSHKYLCYVRAHLGFDKTIDFLALKATLKGVKEFGKNTEGSQIYRSDKYKEIVKFPVFKYSTIDMLDMAVSIAKVFVILKAHTDILEEYNLIGKEKLLKCLMFHDAMINTNNIKLNKIANCEVQVRDMFRCHYSVFNLFSHSCFENVVYHFYGSTVVARALTDIKKGQQCFINYLDSSNFYVSYDDSSISMLDRHIQLSSSKLAIQCKCSESMALSGVKILPNIEIIWIINELENNKAEANSLISSNMEESEKKAFLNKCDALRKQMPYCEIIHALYRVIFTCLFYKGNIYEAF